MKSTLLAKFTPTWTAAAILLISVSFSTSNAMTASHRWHQGRLVGKPASFRLMVPKKSPVDSWYQPPRSPGYNEDFGS
jgi:hypothetical protein